MLDQQQEASSREMSQQSLLHQALDQDESVDFEQG